MNLAQAFELLGTVVAIITILGVGVRLLDRISDLKTTIATLTTEITEIKRRLDKIEGHYAAFGST